MKKINNFASFLPQWNSIKEVFTILTEAFEKIRLPVKKFYLVNVYMTKTHSSTF